MDRGASAPYHRNRYGSDIAPGTDLNGLPAAIGLQHQVCSETRRLDEHVDLAAARGSLQIAENIPACLVPVAGDSITLARNIAVQVEFVAGVGAAKGCFDFPENVV